MTNKRQSLIRNSKLVRQTVDFSGVKNGSMHPTDIDAVLEFNNEILILIEVKRRNIPIPLGQKILLERLCDSWHTDKGIVLKVEHSHYDDNTDIPLDSCYVTRLYRNGKWSNAKEKVKLIPFLNNLGLLWECEKCKF